MLEIKRAQFEDCHTLLRLMRDLAREEGKEETITVTVEQLQEDGFGPEPAYEAHLAYIDDAVVGFCLHHYIYSGWRGKRLVYLEDLYIVPEYRNLGYGKMLLHYLAHLAYQKNTSLVWEVDREDFSKRHFYFHMGATDRNHKVGFYLEGNSLENFVENALRPASVY